MAFLLMSFKPTIHMASQSKVSTPRMNEAKTMSSSYSPHWTPDVLVSFKDDEVKTFISTLFARLEQAGIGCRCFPKNPKNLNKAIRQARFAIVVLSANYRSSCLDELVEILLRRGNSKYPSLVVIPIFHGMEPAEDPELREQGEFMQAFNSLPGKEKDKDKVWSHALAEVEGMSCYKLKKETSGDESKLIDKIVERLVNEIRSLYSHKVFGPFGNRDEKSWHSDKINGIDAVYTEFVESLTFQVRDNTGFEPITTKNTYKVKLEKDEGIISFSGYFQDAMGGGRGIQALTFRTTQRRELRVGPTIDGREADFSVPLPPDAGKVIEFFGSKHGKGFLTSIGARVELESVELESVELPSEVSGPVGLFGIKRGVNWEAKWPAALKGLRGSKKNKNKIKGLRAVRDSSGNRFIRSIEFLFDDGEWRPHGSSDKKWHVEFLIHDPDEYLSSISGYRTRDCITSLTFLTSKNSTITIGDGRGIHFSSPQIGYKIVGFSGWSDEHLLYGIRAYFEPIPSLRQVKSIGPFGGGIAWDDGKYKAVKKIHIFREGGIRYIKIVYADDSGNDCPIIHGDYTREFSNKEDTVNLKYPQEYLTSICGYTGDDGSIESLIFHSNKNIICFDPPPRKGDPPKVKEYFGYPSNKSRIVGFYGTYGKTLNSIGVYEELIPDWEPVSHIPFPGSGGTNWNDEAHSNVVGYRVTEDWESEGSPKIESITFMYENNGSLVEGSRRGGGDPSSGDWVMLDYPKECLYRIRGYWREEAGETIIHDLKIVTSCTNPTYAERGAPDSDSESKPKLKPKSKRKSKHKSERKPEPEPKPEIEWPKRFTILEKDDVGRRIVGFFGQAKTCLNFIGAYLEP